MLRVPQSTLGYTAEGLYEHFGVSFTGQAYALDSAGNLIGEQEFKDGMRWGTMREWLPGGRLVKEAEFAQDVYHGNVREWFPRGSVRSSAIYEFGIKISESIWDEAGNMVSQYRLDPSSRESALLEKYREIYGSK